MDKDAETLLQKRRRFLISFAYYVSIAGAIWFFFKRLLGIALPFVLGFGLALTLKPAADAISARLRLRRRSAAIAVTSTCCAAVAAALCLLGLFAANSARRLMLQLPQLCSEELFPALERLESLAERLPPETAVWLDEGLRALGRRIAAALVERSAEALSALPELALTLTFTILFSLFICADYERMTGLIYRLLPERHRRRLSESRASLARGIPRLLGAQLLLTLVSFALLLTAFWLLGAGNAPGMAAVTALLDALPAVGAGIVLVPWALLELLRGNAALCAGLLITFGITSVVRSLLEPRLIGKRLGISPAASLAAMYLGLRLFGVAGLLLAPLPLIILAAKRK